MKPLIQTAFTLLALPWAVLGTANAQTTQHLSDQSQAVKQKGLALANRTRPTNGNTKTPQVLRGGRNADCSLNIASPTTGTTPGNRFANSHVTPQQQTIVNNGTTVVVCGR